MRPADRAWLALAGGVIAYDVLAPDGETLSEAVDRWLEHHPWLTRAVIMTVARHLVNELGLDPLALGFGLLRRWRKTPVVIVVETP